jgi:hypothetical protein
MARRQTPKQGVVDLVARRERNKQEKAMKLAILRYRYLKSLSENATDASEKAKLHQMALTCLANLAEKESDGSAI